MTITATKHHARIRRGLERLLHVLLTHHGDASESKADFAARCAWDVEGIIDELECPTESDGPTPVSEIIGDLAERNQRIARRKEQRQEDDWG